eukprot:6462267-Pyramimonas_sp.AAC.1
MVRMMMMISIHVVDPDTGDDDDNASGYDSHDGYRLHHYRHDHHGRHRLITTCHHGARTSCE